VTSNLTIGVDVGGTKVRVGLVDDLGTVHLLAEASTRSESRADPGLRTCLALTQQVADRAAEQGLMITGVGVGMPEYVHRNLVQSELVIGWTTQPAELFAKIAPVTVESDVRCGALAETRLGAGRACDSMLYVSVGSGISCSIVFGGTVWSGYRGEALALGEFPIDRTLDDDGAANLEDFASGTAIAARYQRATGQPVDGAREVIARAESQDQQARIVVETATKALGCALAWAVDIVDPELVVLGGGLGSSGGWWMQQVRAHYLTRSRPAAPNLKPAALGADSGVVGAAMAARELSLR
jgi:glucokinase